MATAYIFIPSNINVGKLGATLELTSAYSKIICLE